MNETVIYSIENIDELVIDKSKCEKVATRILNRIIMEHLITIDELYWLIYEIEDNGKSRTKGYVYRSEKETNNISLLGESCCAINTGKSYFANVLFNTILDQNKEYNITEETKKEAILDAILFFYNEELRSVASNEIFNRILKVGYHEEEKGTILSSNFREKWQDEMQNVYGQKQKKEYRVSFCTVIDRQQIKKNLSIRTMEEFENYFAEKFYEYFQKYSIRIECE